MDASLTSNNSSKKGSPNSSPLSRLVTAVFEIHLHDSTSRLQITTGDSTSLSPPPPHHSDPSTRTSPPRFRILVTVSRPAPVQLSPSSISTGRTLPRTTVSGISRSLIDFGRILALLERSGFA